MDKERLYQALRNAHAAGDTQAATRLAQYIREVHAGEAAKAEMAAATPAQAPQKSFMQNVGGVVDNVVAGGLRGAGSIGSTILGLTVDPLARATGIDKTGFGYATGLGKTMAERRQGIDDANRTLGANPDSWLYKAGKIGGEIAGTAGVGGTLAKGAMAVPQLARFAPALQSGGFTLGDAATKSAFGNAAIRSAAGGASGLAMAGAVNPNDAVTGGVIGAALPPSVRALGTAGGYINRNVAALPRSLIQPFTSAGQRQVAGNVLRNTATNADDAVKKLSSSPGMFVPGSAPTLGQVADDAGLAQLERSMVNRPELQQAYGQQRASRLKVLDTIAGEPGYIDELKAGRKLFANEDFAKAYAQGFDGEALAKNAGRIEELLQRPSIKKSVDIAKELAGERGQKIDDFGSVKGMDYLRKALDEQISSAKNMGSSVGTERLNALNNTKKEMLSVLSETSPAYREAVQNYADMSKKINAAEAAAYVKGKFQPALADYGATNRELSDGFARALKEAEGSIKKSTGMDLPLARVMPKADYDALQGVAKDLARKSNLENAGRAVGSNTQQNILSQNLTGNMVRSLGLPKSVSESGLLNVLTSPYQMLGNVSGASQRIDDLLSQAVSDPSMALSLMQEAQLAAARRGGLLGSTPSQAITGGGLLRLAPSTAPTMTSNN
jgi:hypothetical protein